MRQILIFCGMLALCFACSTRQGLVKLSTNDKSVWKADGNVSFDESEMILSGQDTEVVAEGNYKNFELNMECKTDPGAIAGVLVHSKPGVENSGYEVLINNNIESDEWRKSGSLSTIRNFAKPTAKNGEWFPIHISVKGKQIKVTVNDMFVTDYTEPEKPYRESAYSNRLFSDGRLAFVNKRNSSVAFRNIIVNILPDDETGDSEPVDEQTDEIIRLQQQNFPTIDCHLHIKGGWTKEAAAEQSRLYGITYGIAPNCGKNFPITTDRDIQNWLDTMRCQPFLTPMQAEGREWVTMFSDEAVNRFDYKFTDAMTWTDHKGRRLRIWIPEETFVDDKNQFMDMLVDRACEIISTEPIDIFVNPTFLPAELMPEYDGLWTEERMQRIIDAAVKNNTAIEINNRFKIPSAAFIKQAKQSGAKFTIGTNNEGADDVGKMEYAIQMIKECNLTADDMFIPTGKL